MKTTIPPESYRNFINQLRIVKKMNTSKFIQWVTTIYQEGYDDGWNTCMEKWNTTNGGVNVDESIDAEVIDAGMLMDIMLSVKGIGRNRAQQVIDKIIELESGEEQ